MSLNGQCFQRELIATFRWQHLTSATDLRILAMHDYLADTLLFQAKNKALALIFAHSVLQSTMYLPLPEPQKPISGSCIASILKSGQYIKECGASSLYICPSVNSNIIVSSICPHPYSIWDIKGETESIRQLNSCSAQLAPLFIALHAILAPHSFVDACRVFIREKLQFH